LAGCGAGFNCRLREYRTKAVDFVLLCFLVLDEFRRAIAIPEVESANMGERIFA
jgi:hypothetical protein